MSRYKPRIIYLPQNAAEEELVMAMGGRNYLLLFRIKQWERLIDRISKQSEIPENRKRMLLRYFVAPSILLELDEEQRVEIPEPLWKSLCYEKEIKNITMFHAQDYLQYLEQSVNSDKMERVSSFEKMLLPYAAYVIAEEE